nr:tryptophan synthase beta chain 1 [Tanacetum cinerariifolium]
MMLKLRKNAFIIHSIVAIGWRSHVEAEGHHNTKVGVTNLGFYPPVEDIELQFRGEIKFARAEGLIPASKPTHAIAVAIWEALHCKKSGESKPPQFSKLLLQFLIIQCQQFWKSVSCVSFIRFIDGVQERGCVEGQRDSRKEDGEHRLLCGSKYCSEGPTTLSWT